MPSSQKILQNFTIGDRGGIGDSGEIGRKKLMADG
jgi:hypothetical protein